MEETGIKLEDGDFGENLLTKCIDLSKLKIGSTLKINKDILLRITQIGKECHDRCNIYYQVGDCIMPREGLFAEVLKGGIIRVDDTIEVLHVKSGNINH